MIRYEQVKTTAGVLTAVVTRQGVAMIEFGEMSASGVARRFGASAEDIKPDRLKVSGELSRYFEGKVRRFRTKVDLRLVSGFRRRVLEALLTVPFGELVTYGELAAMAGSPGGARAVGGAMRTNPIPIVVPCHRVVAADGTLGGFSSGLDRKRVLHRIEGIAARTGGWVPSKRRAHS